MPNGFNANPQYDVEGDQSPNPSRNVVYTSLRYDRLNVLDRIARYILAVAYSGQYSGSSRSQGYIGVKTVAVAVHGSTLYVAANGVWGNGGDDGSRITTYNRIIGELDDELDGDWIGVDEVTFLRNLNGDQDRNLHAEMQLLAYFDSKGWRFVQDTIGVSKPCCYLCATELDRRNYLYSYWHGEPVNWEHPSTGVLRRYRP